MSERILFTGCPLCHSPNTGNQKVADCSRHRLYHEALNPRMVWKKCFDCSHVFTEGFFTEEASKIIFGKVHENQKVGFAIEQNRTLSAKMVEKVLPYASEGRWLDVGFGNGSLLFTAQEYGFEPVGLDLRPDTAKEMEAFGIEAYCADICGLSAKESFSVISMADVLEHMPYPRTALRAANTLLRGKGVLLVSMPNSESVLWKDLDRRNQNPYWGEIEHYHNFGRSRLYALLSECGFEAKRYGVSERYRCCMEVVALKCKDNPEGATMASTRTTDAPAPDDALRAAIGLHGAGRYAEALAVMENLLAALPEDALFLNVAAACSLRAGKPREAENYLTRAVRANPDFAEAHNNLGVLFLEEQRFGEAEEAYRHALALRPDYPEAHCNLGNLLWRRDRPEEAEEAYRRTISLQPGHAEAHNNLGVLLLARKRFGEAEEAYRRALALRPDYADAHFNLGNLFVEEGRPAEAEREYRLTLSLRPDYAETHSNLGNLLQKQGRSAEAEEAYRSALSLRPDYPDANYNLGILLAALNRFAEAEEAYRRALALRPDHAEAHNNLGLALKERMRFTEAEEEFRSALSLRPDYSEAHNNLAILFQEQKRPGEAEREYRLALSLRPDYPEAHNNLGVLLKEQGRFPEAEEAYRGAIALRPDYADAHNNLANLLQEQNRPAEAEEACRRALSLCPTHAGAHNSLGILLRAANRLAEAEESYRRALSFCPDYADAHSNLGNLLQGQNRFEEAEEAYRSALSSRPDHAGAHNNLGALLQEQKRFDEAEAAYRRALEIDSGHDLARANLLHLHQHMCLWRDLKREAALVFESIGANRGGTISPFSLLSIPESAPMLQRECARQNAEHDCAHSLARPPLHEATRQAPGGRLRLGCLSGDFRSHAVSFLLAEVMELLDRGRFETIGYSCGPDDLTPISKRIRGAFDRLRNIQGGSFEAAAQRIADDSVDIPVDLAGYTKFRVTRILALRPAPVQVNWLGYPGTMGCERLADYIVGDPVVTPPAHAAFYSETLALMPHCYQPNDRQRRIGPPTTREAHGLPDKGFVFCSFNQGYKITPELFSLWARLLASVPASVLWLLEDDCGPARENLFSEAALRGISRERLIFAGRVPLADHLARLRLADLMLDTFPYTSHTTASDALWVGLPLVTRLGETFAARVAGSLLHAAGLPQLVTTTFDDYFDLALDLATHRMNLAALKDRLAGDRLACPLFDSARFTRDLERLFERMWENHLSGRKERIVLTDEP